MPDQYNRRREIDRRVNEHQLTAPTGQYANDRITLLRDLLRVTDLAMEIEGVPAITRDRVIHTLIYGEPPGGNSRPESAAALQRISGDVELGRPSQAFSGAA